MRNHCNQVILCAQDIQTLFWCLYTGRSDCAFSTLLVLALNSPGCGSHCYISPYTGKKRQEKKSVLQFLGKLEFKKLIADSQEYQLSLTVIIGP